MLTNNEDNGTNGVVHIYIKIIFNATKKQRIAVVFPGSLPELLTFMQISKSGSKIGWGKEST